MMYSATYLPLKLINLKESIKLDISLGCLQLFKKFHNSGSIVGILKTLTNVEMCLNETFLDKGQKQRQLHHCCIVVSTHCRWQSTVGRWRKQKFIYLGTLIFYINTIIMIMI